MNDYYKKKAKEHEEMVRLLCWLWAVLVAFAVIKWIISFF